MLDGAAGEGDRAGGGLAVAAQIEGPAGAGDRARGREQVIAAAQLQRAVGDHRAADIRVRAGESQRAAVGGQRATAGDHAGVGAAAVDCQPGVADGAAGAIERAHRDHVAVLVQDAAIDSQRGIGQECAGPPQLERAALDRGSTRVSVRAAQHQEAALVGEGATAGDDARKTAAAGDSQPGVADRAAGAIEGANGDRIAILVEDAAGESQGVRAREGAGGAEPQRATRDQRGAGISIIGGQHGHAAAILDQSAGAGDPVGDVVGVAAAEDQVGVIGHKAGAERAARAIGADLQGPVINQGGAAVGISAS